MKYCHNCDWEIETTGGFPHQEQSRAAIEHFLATGHTVDSRDSFTRASTHPVSGHGVNRDPGLPEREPQDD